MLFTAQNDVQHFVIVIKDHDYPFLPSDTGQRCPVDNEILLENQLFPDNFAKREILSLTVRCPNKDCIEKMELRHLEVSNQACQLVRPYRLNVQCSACTVWEEPWILGGFDLSRRQEHFIKSYQLCDILALLMKIDFQRLSLTKRPNHLKSY